MPGCDRLPPSKELIGAVSGDLDWIVMKCLEKDRSRRYETANGLAMEVVRYMSSEPIIARSPGNLYRLQKLFRKHQVVFSAVIGVVIALLAGAIISIVMARRAIAAEEAPCAPQIIVATTSTAGANHTPRLSMSKASSRSTSGAGGTGALRSAAFTLQADRAWGREARAAGGPSSRST